MKARNKIILSMSIFGTIALLIRSINLASSEIALYRAILAVLCIATYLVIQKKSIYFSQIKKQIPLLFISGMALGINWILLFQSYKYTTVSMATLCYYFAPVIIILVCSLLFKEKMTSKKLFCFLMSTIGLIMIIGVQDINNTHMKGIIFGISAAVFYASVVLLNKYIKSVDGITRTLFQFIAAIITLLPYVAINEGFHLNTLTTTGWICLAIVGIVHTGICYCLYFSALHEVSGQEAALLSYIDPLVAIIMSVVVLQETITFIQIIGGILILGFTYLNETK